VVPKLEFSITAYYAPQAVTTTFVANIARNTGKVNSATWLGFAAGELLFLGGSGQGDIPTVAGQRVKPIPITFKFAASENRTNIKVGDITVPSKAGWDYLWVRYEKIEDAGFVFPIPVHAYVEKVYEHAGIDSRRLLLHGGLPARLLLPQRVSVLGQHRRAGANDLAFGRLSGSRARTSDRAAQGDGTCSPPSMPVAIGFGATTTSKKVAGNCSPVTRTTGGSYCSRPWPAAVRPKRSWCCTRMANGARFR
jgi:hypothetical protein